MKEFTLPLRAPDPGDTVAFYVDWGDGSTETFTYDESSFTIADFKHEYVDSNGDDLPASEFTIKIYPVVGSTFGKYWGFETTGVADRPKLKEIKKWGCFEFSNLGSAFYGCANLNISATDTTTSKPKINPESMKYAFYGCESLNPSAFGATADAKFNAINTTGVTSFHYTFGGCQTFNTNVNNWDVSSAEGNTAFYRMFYDCSIFNPSNGLNDWEFKTEPPTYNSSTTYNTGDLVVRTTTAGGSAYSGPQVFRSKVDSNQGETPPSYSTSHSNFWEHQGAQTAANISFNGMFYNCQDFNKPLSGWNTEEVSGMSEMFRGAADFNQDISDWNVSNATSMQRMFELATSFDNYNSAMDWGNNDGGANWELTNMQGMFQGATAFNRNINTWDTSKTTTLQEAFENAISFNNGGQALTIDTGEVTVMSQTFSGATGFNQSVSSWDTRKVVNMHSMFKGALNFNQSLEHPTTEQSHHGDSYKPWDTSLVVHMTDLFKNAADFNQNIASWNIIDVTDATDMFEGSGQNAANATATSDGWQAQVVQEQQSNPSYTSPAATQAQAAVPEAPVWTGSVLSAFSQPFAAVEGSENLAGGMLNYVDWDSDNAGTLTIVEHPSYPNDHTFFNYSTAGAGSIWHTGSGFDFENPQDSDGNNTYSIMLRATDLNGLHADLPMSFTVTNDTSDDVTDPVVKIFKGVGKVSKYQVEYHQGQLNDYFHSSGSHFSQTQSTLIHIKENACFICSGKNFYGSTPADVGFHLINPGSAWTLADHGTETNEMSVRSGFEADSGRISYAEYDKLPTSGAGVLKTMFFQRKTDAKIYILVESGGVFAQGGSNIGNTPQFIENPFTGVKSMYATQHGGRIVFVMKEGSKLAGVSLTSHNYDIIYENDFEVLNWYTSDAGSDFSFDDYITNHVAADSYRLGAGTHATYNPNGDHKYFEKVSYSLDAWQPGGVDKIVTIDPLFENPIEEITFTESQLAGDGTQGSGVYIDVPTIMPLKTGDEANKFVSARALGSLKYPSSSTNQPTYYAHLDLGSPENVYGGGNDRVELLLSTTSLPLNESQRTGLGMMLEYEGVHERDLLPRSQWSNYFSTFDGYSLAAGQDGELYAWGSAKRNDGSARFAHNPGVSGGVQSRGGSFIIEEGNQTLWDTESGGNLGAPQPNGTYTWNESTEQYEEAGFSPSGGAGLGTGKRIKESAVGGFYSWTYIHNNTAIYGAEVPNADSNPWDAEWNWSEVSWDVNPSIGISATVTSSDTELFHATKLFEANFSSSQFGKVQGVATGYDHNLFIRTEKSGSNFINKLYSWGTNTYGQRGNNVVDDDTINEVPNGTYATSVAAGSSFTVYIRDLASVGGHDGTLWCMGSNSYGQLCRGNQSNVTGVPVSTGITGVLKVRCGIYHTMFLKEDGSLWGAGDNTYGQLGQGEAASVVTPVKIADNVTDFDCGHYHSAYIVGNNTSRLFTFGKNTNGQLGVGTTAVAKTPQPIGHGGGPGVFTSFGDTNPDSALWHMVTVHCGAEHTVSVSRDGEFFVAGGSSGSGMAQVLGSTDNVALGRDNYNFTKLSSLNNRAHIAVVGNGCIFYVTGHENTRPFRTFTTKMRGAGDAEKLGLGTARKAARIAAYESNPETNRIDDFVGVNNFPESYTQDATINGTSNKPFVSVFPTDQYLTKEVTIDENNTADLFDKPYITLSRASLVPAYSNRLSIDYSLKADTKRLGITGFYNGTQVKVFCSLVRGTKVIDNSESVFMEVDGGAKTGAVVLGVDPQKDDILFLYCPAIGKSVSAKVKPAGSGDYQADMQFTYKLGLPDSGNLSDLTEPVASFKDYYMEGAYQAGGRSWDRDDGPVGWMHGSVVSAHLNNKFFAGSDARLGDGSVNMYNELKDGTYRITKAEWEALPSYTCNGENLNANDEYELLRIGKNMFMSASYTSGGTSNWQSAPDFVITEHFGNNQRVALHFLTNAGLKVNWGDGTETVVPPTDHINRTHHYEKALVVHKYDENDPSYPNFTVSVYGDNTYLNEIGYNAGSGSPPPVNSFARYYLSGGGAHANDSSESICPELYSFNTTALTHLLSISAANVRTVPRFAYDGEDIKNLQYYFAGMSNMTTAPTKMLGKVEYMSYAFLQCSNFNSSLAEWNTSSLYYGGFRYVFKKTCAFNNALPDLSPLFDSKHYTAFTNIFQEAWAFNQPLNWGDKFDSEVNYDFSYLFQGAYSFNQPINWNIKVNKLYQTFRDAFDFNQPLNNWQLASDSSTISGGPFAANNNFYGTFDRAMSFNQNLNDWDVSTISAFPGSSHVSLTLSYTFNATRSFQNGGVPLNWGENLTQFIRPDDGSAQANLMQVSMSYFMYRSAYNHDLKPWHDAGFFRTGYSGAHLYILPSGYSHSFRGWTDYPWGTHPWNLLYPNYDTTLLAANWDDTIIWFNEYLTGGGVFQKPDGSYGGVYLAPSRTKRTSASAAARANLLANYYSEADSPTGWIASLSDAGERS